MVSTQNWYCCRCKAEHNSATWKLYGVETLKVQDALLITQQAQSRDGTPIKVFLACSFTPLHLRTFLAANVAQQCPGRPVICEIGDYGNLASILERKECVEANAVAVVVEWPDLDRRLGYRTLGGWTIGVLDDILLESERRLAHLEKLINHVARNVRVVVALPTLPLPPVFPVSRRQIDRRELLLRHHLSEFATNITSGPNVLMVNPEHLSISVPLSHRRHDIGSELLADFPYTREHASSLGAALAEALWPPPPMKGLITDLDDTLWRGLVGEIGCEKISWDLDGNSQIHGIYQQMLGSLAEVGVFLGVCSKNEPSVVQTALERRDLKINCDRFFPIEAGWNPKSEMIAKILKAWNIGADAVVFVDDSPLEVAEVQVRFPEMRCVLFPSRDSAKALQLIGNLRDWFGRSTITAEDLLRVESIRNVTQWDVADNKSSMDAFLADTDAKIDIYFSKDTTDSRPFELVNKTNQFNLNGLRWDEHDWRKMIKRPDSFLMVVSYADKFGALGKIGAMFGRYSDMEVEVDGWVLSCRAFSRRIEFSMLRVLFERFSAEGIKLAFSTTPKNRPLQEFLTSLTDLSQSSPSHINRHKFDSVCPPLFHKIAIYD